MIETSEQVRPPHSGGCAQVAVGLAFIVVVALLGLVGYRAAVAAGWLSGGAGMTSTGAPGVFASGQLIETPLREAPNFTLQLYSGEQLRLSDLRGKPIILNFWASWCPPCRQEARLLEQTWRAYADKDVVLVGVNVWDSEEDARKFLEEYGITYANGPDPGGQILVDYGLAGIPETYLIDREGQIAHKWIGPFSDETLRSLLDELLARAG